MMGTIRQRSMLRHVKRRSCATIQDVRPLHSDTVCDIDSPSRVLTLDTEAARARSHFQLHRASSTFTSEARHLPRPPGVGILHWGDRPEIVGLRRMMSRPPCRSLDRLCPSCACAVPHGRGDPAAVHGMQRRAAIAYGMAGTGFQWYDTNQAHIVSNTTFRRCGARAVHAPGSASTDGCNTVGCQGTSSVWEMLTHSDEHVPEYMQASKTIRYESCGLRYRFVNWYVDNGTPIGNGLSSTVSERITSWLDADGSTSRRNVPCILGSGTTQAGQWWRLDNDCTELPNSLMLACQTHGTRQIGSINLDWGATWDPTTECANNGATIPCRPKGYIKHWGHDVLDRRGLCPACHDQRGGRRPAWWLWMASQARFWWAAAARDQEDSGFS